jgi:hypothetical protein
MTMQALWSNGQHLQFLNEVQGLKAFKIVQYGKEKRKLVGYFEIWETLHRALNSKPVWEEKPLLWTTHHSPNHTKKAKKPPAAKSTIQSGLSYADVLKSNRTKPKVQSRSQKPTKEAQKMEKMKAVLVEMLRCLD